MLTQQESANVRTHMKVPVPEWTHMYIRRNCMYIFMGIQYYNAKHKMNNRMTK